MPLTLAATGDSIVSRPLHDLQEPRFSSVAGELHDSDVAFSNLELATPTGSIVPGVKQRGIYISAPEAILDSLKEMGIGLFSTANNHTLDYGTTGLVDTLDALSKRGLAQAGGGRTLTEARKPAYVNTKHGVVALVAATTTFSERLLAADPVGSISGRPGINPLRFSTKYGLTTLQFEALSDICRTFTGTAAAGKAFRLFGLDFIRDDESAVRTNLHGPDMAAIVDAIRQAREKADFVIASLHFHEGPSGSLSVEDRPASHIIEAAHRCIDAGADALLGHGPHQLQAIEIYRRRPIFYSLGNLFFMLESIGVLPPECYENVGLPANSTPDDYANTNVHGHFYASSAKWRSVIAKLRYSAPGQSPSIELTPIDLGFARKGESTRGIPLLADADAGREILESLAGLSSAFGTHIQLEKRGSQFVGVIGAQNA